MHNVQGGTCIPSDILKIFNMLNILKYIVYYKSYDFKCSISHQLNGLQLLAWMFYLTFRDRTGNRNETCVCSGNTVYIILSLKVIFYCFKKNNKKSYEAFPLLCFSERVYIELKFYLFEIVNRTLG